MYGHARNHSSSLKNGGENISSDTDINHIIHVNKCRFGLR